jgi:hypothetical protein
MLLEPEILNSNFEQHYIKWIYVYTLIHGLVKKNLPALDVKESHKNISSALI